jgi:aspartate carbamoyltransferase catalytic subunit
MTLELAQALSAPKVWQPAKRHLITIDDLDDDGLARVLALAQEFSSVERRDIKKLPTLRGKTVLNMFFESSTRTSSSFELAAKRLSADLLSVKAAGSAVDKGESLKDTIQTLDAYSPDVVVIRHASIGAPYRVARYTGAHVVNAGDGKHEHPTQCLLDLYTMHEACGRLRGLHVAIVGDVLHSRVARSDIRGLVRMGACVTLVGPPTLVPAELARQHANISISHDIRDIASADVVYVLRMQLERMGTGASYVPSLREYTARWAVTPERVSPHQWIMHPGPMNRGIEIDGAVADGPRSLITRQVQAGLWVRMAALYDLVTRPLPDTAAAAEPVNASAARGDDVRTEDEPSGAPRATARAREPIPTGDPGGSPHGDGAVLAGATKTGEEA